MQWGTPEMNGQCLWKLIQWRDVLQTQHSLVFRQLKKKSLGYLYEESFAQLS
jgi:hypothetical protein